jgi:CheY-like chemotaxis protein
MTLVKGRRSMNEVPDEGGQIRVLVVDDNVDAAEALCALLEVMGCATAVGHDGPRGIAAACEFNPHLAFIDLEMPGMNGREVVRHLRANGMAAARLICLTGRAQAEDRRLCLEVGFDSFITKPMDAHALALELAALAPDF